MIFRRKKNVVAEDPTLDEGAAEERDEISTAEDTGDAGDTEAGDTDPGDTDLGNDEAASESGSQNDNGDDANALDLDALDAADWRDDGPYDITEIDAAPGDPDADLDSDPEDLDDDTATADDGARIDLGSVILTGIEGMELRLQMAEETQQLVSAMMMKGESALEVAAYAAPRSGGLWAELREDMVEQTTEAGGSHSLVEGPFGVELRRMLPVSMPDGEQGFQPSRMWVAEGPRWLLRGIVYGRAALEEGLDGPVEDLLAAFRGIIVRRGNEAKAPGDLLPLAIPEDLVRAQEEPNR